MTVVVKVEQLVAPLSDDTERILEEGDDDQESSNGRKVSKQCAATLAAYPLFTRF